MSVSINNILIKELYEIKKGNIIISFFEVKDKMEIKSYY